MFGCWAGTQLATITTTKTQAHGARLALYLAAIRPYLDMMERGKGRVLRPAAALVVQGKTRVLRIQTLLPRSDHGFASE